MALMFCRECGKKISDTADKCIHCGAPINKNIANIKNNETPVLKNNVQFNAQISIVVSLIVIVGNYIWWVNDLINSFNLGIGFKIGYFVFGFFICVGLGSLILNTSDAMSNLANKNK